jgi:aspartyl-tRNA(Asn)/glutamyl-tRNA(Gln) amidotransferase subunit A
LDGIPIAFKDNFCTKNVLTTCGSKMLSTFIPPYNATVVQRLVNQCGSVLLGKTNLDEFAMGSGCVDSIFGPTINPWKSCLPFKVKNIQNNEMQSFNDLPQNDWYISGGSSGGSAVAVASGAVFGAISSDTGGSTRNPAARVGIIGFKPTYGLVSRYGLIPLTHSMDVTAIMARTVDDVSLILKSIAGHDVCDSTTLKENINLSLNEDIDLSQLNIGIPEEYQCEGMSPEVIETWRTVTDILSNFGAKVRFVSLPHTKYSISCYSVLNCCEIASNFSCYDGIEFGHRAQNSEDSVEELYSKSRYEGFSDTVKGRIFAGNYFLLRENYEQFFNKALKVRRLIANDFNHVFYEQNIDILLTPVTLTEAPLYSQWIKKDNRQQVSTEDYCTQPVNMAGLPAISIPCKLSNKGLPISLQLIGKKLDDFYILSIAKKLENILNFPQLIYDETI